MMPHLDVFSGPMFAGKTAALIARVRSAFNQGLTARVFKPLTDTRVAAAEVRTHTGDSIEAIWTPPDGSAIPSGLDLVALDEAQFFSFDVLPRLLALMQEGTNVVVAGLDLTSKGEPFGPMPALMAYANEVHKLTARCSCGEAATRSYRKVEGKATVLVGGSDAYEPRCFACFNA
jgi:thymidine kinase